MNSKTTSFWMAAAIVGSITLFILQQYAPSHIKPLHNRLIDYPNSIPTLLQINQNSVQIHQAPTRHQPLPLWRYLSTHTVQIPTIAIVNNKPAVTMEGVDIRQVNKTTAKSATTKTVKKIQEEVYEEQNGDEEFRYGYQVKSNQTYVDHSNGDTCNDGGGTISGTYCAPNGERYNVNVASTNQAAANYNAAVVEKIKELTPDEVVTAANQVNPTITNNCLDTACQQQTLDKALEIIASSALLSEKKADVQSVKELYLENQKALDYINLSKEELEKKYGSTDLTSLLPTLSASALKELEAERIRQQTIISSAITETTESQVNGKTVYTMTTTYTDPDTGKVIDTQTLSYTAETSTTKEKVDNGFVTHDTIIFRDTKTGNILDAQTTSYILKSSTRTYKTAGKSSGGTVEQVGITTTTATDANTGEVIQTTRTYAETSKDNPNIILIQRTTTPSTTAGDKPKTTTTKSTISNPNYIAPTTNNDTQISNPIIFTKKLGEVCTTNTDCSTGLCGRTSVVVKDATCQPNPNQSNVSITASPESCPANTTLNCRGTACACLSQDQQVKLTTLENASSGNLPALAATIPKNYSYKNDNNAIGNYAIANGNLAINKLLTYADTGWSTIPSWDRYKNSFNPSNVQRQWQILNYQSLEDCQANMPTTFKNGIINGSFLCNDVVYSQEQFTSSVALGTDLTTIGAAVTGIPGALKAGGNILLNASLNSAVTGVKYTLGQSAITALQAALPTIGTFGAISTANQTGNTAVSCLDGSDTCARDLGYTTLSWLNLGSMEYISSAMASRVASQIRNAQIVNTTLTVANAGTDIAIANESCFGENKTTAGCLASAGVIAFDFVGGFFDLKTGQFIFQKVPDLNVNSAALASLANNPVPQSTKSALDPIIDNTAKAVVPPVPNITVLKNGDVNNPLIIKDIQIDGINTARIDESAIADQVLRSRAELTNALLDEFAADIGYQPYPAQVAELLSGKTVMQLKYPDGHALAGQPIAGKTDIIARIASVGEPRSIVLTKGTTEAMDYVNTQMLGPGGQSFYQSQGTTGIFVHNELGFLEIDFTKGSFNPNTARVMSADEVTTLLKNNLDLPNESRLVFVADRPQAAWTRLKGNDVQQPSQLKQILGIGEVCACTPTPGTVFKDLLSTNTYGSMLIIADEISEDIKGVFAISGSGIPLKEVADATLLGGVKSGDQAINIFKQAVDESPTHQQFTSARSVELKSGVGVASSLQNLGDGNFIPVDKKVYGNTLADLVDQSLKKYSHRISKLGKELADLMPALRSGDPAAIKNFEALLADAPPSSLLTDITFRKSSIQSDYNMLARVPGSDFGIEGNDLVLRKATATTGEKLSGPTDLLAFYYRGYDMTQAYNPHMIEKIDPTKPITRVELSDISISPQGSKITITNFYQEMERAGHKLMGLDATPQEAISALYLKDTPIETKITPAHLATDTNRSGLVDQFVDRRASQFNNNASAVVLAKTNSDMNADLLALVKKSQEKGVGYTEVIVAQYKKQPNGIEAEEYLAYPVKSNGEIDFTNRRNLGDAQGWNTAIQSKLSGDKPQELLIVYMGRERAADLKITSNHDKIRWSLLFETSGGELPTEVSFEQMWRRNRIFNDVNNNGFAKSMDFDLYLTTTRTDLTPDNVQTAYFRENLNTKLANDRFTATLDDIAKSPIRALEQIKALKNDKMSFVAAVRFKNLIERLEQEVGTFENILRTGLSPDLLTGDDLYRELHLRASRSNARILKMAEEAAQILGYSDGQLASLKNNLHVTDSFPDWPLFKAELDTLTTEFSAPESYGPADLLMAYAKNNSTSAGSAPQFRATNQRYIAPTTPTTATSPRTVDINAPINDHIRPPASLTNTLVNLTTNPSMELTLYGEILFRNFAATLNPTSAQSRVEQAQRNLDTLMSNQNTGVYISDSEMALAKAELQAATLSRDNGRDIYVPILDNETVYDTLTSPGATLGFITKDNIVIEFNNQNGVINYSENGTTPTTVSITETLDLLPSGTDITLISRNNQTFEQSSYTIPTTQRPLSENSKPTKLITLGKSIATPLTRTKDQLINQFNTISPIKLAQPTNKTNESGKQTSININNRNKLIYILTGIIWNDQDQSEILKKVITDIPIIRQKYGLPNREEAFDNPREYIRKLEQIAKDNNIIVRKGHEFEAFFDKDVISNRGFYNPSTNELVVNEDEYTYKDINTFRAYIFVFEHELIHALQHLRYPNMPIELMEYEAHAAANTSITNLTNNTHDALVYLFQARILDSLNKYYISNNATPSWHQINLDEIQSINDRVVDPYNTLSNRSSDAEIAESQSKLSSDKIAQVPMLNSQTIEKILNTDNTSLTFTTFETEDGYVREFTVTGGQLYYSGNLESPRPISLEEALQLLPDPADVAKVDLNDQEVTKTYFLPIPVASHSYRRANDLSMAISSLISRSKIIQPPSNKFLHVSERYTPHNIDLKEVFTSTGFSKSIDPDISFLYIETTGDESSPLTLALPPETPKQSLLTINNVTKTIEQWLLDTRSDYYIKLSPNDTVRYGNHELVVRPLTGNSTLGHTQAPDQTKDLQARLTYLEELRIWATSIDPDIGPVNRFNRAIRYATYKQAVKEFEEAVQQRYQDLDTLHKVIFSYINENPDNHEGILNFTLEQAQKLSFTHTEINNILYAINGYVLQHERVSELRTRYGDSKDKIKEMWEAAFGFEPQGEIQIHYSYNTINLIPNNLTDFGRAYHAGDTTTKSIEPTTADIDNVIKTVGGFHKNNGTLIANTENIFNVVRDDETLAEVITHEDQHGLFKNLEKVFLPSRKNATLATKQEALNIELTRMSGLLDLSTTTYNNLAQINSLNLTETERFRIEEANLNHTAIYITRDVDNDLEEIIFYDARPRPKLGVLQSLNYAGTEGKVIVFRGKGIVDLSNKLIEYAYDERLDAETDVANEVLAQITGIVAIGVPLPDIKVEVAKSLRSHLYAYFVDADKSSTNFNTHETQPEWNQFRRTITQRYYTTKAQQEIVDNALQAYETLILKGWSHSSASFLLQSTRLANWLSVANRAGVHFEANSTPSDIDFSQEVSVYANSISNNAQLIEVKNANELRDAINQQLSDHTISISRRDGSTENYSSPRKSLTVKYFDAYGNTKYTTYTSTPTFLADIIDQSGIKEVFTYDNRDIDLSHPIDLYYTINGEDNHESLRFDHALEIEPTIEEFKKKILDSDPDIEANQLPVPLYIRFTNSLGLKEVYYPYGRTTYSNNNPNSPTTNSTTNTSVNNSSSAIYSNHQNTTSLSPTSTSDAFEQHLAKWDQIEKYVIKHIQEEIKKPEILAERQEKYLEKLFSLINQMTKSPSRSTNNKVLDQLRDLGYPYVSEFGEWIDIGDNVRKANGYDTSKSYWTDAAKWVADQYSGLVSGYASGDLLLELKKAQLSQLELSRQNERKQLIEQFGQPMANLIRTYDDMQSRLPRLKPGQYSAVNEWRKKNAGKYFLLKRTYPKESLEGVNRARYGLDFRVDGLDPVNTTLDEASALFLSRWAQSHADEIDWWPIAVQHSTIPEKRPHFDPLVSTTEQSTNQFAKFGDAEMHLRVPAEKLIPYSILAQERINQLSREISSIEFSNENARNSQKYRQLNEEHSRLLRNISEYEFMIIGHIDMDEITKAPSDCSFCSVEVGKVAETGGTAIRNQDIIAARQAIEIANSHTYERPDLQHVVNAFAYASMGIASSQKSFFNLALSELNNAEKKFNSYEQTGQLLGGNTTIDLSSIDLNGVDPRLIALLSNLPENGSVTAQKPDQVRNTLQTARDYLKELGADTNNLSSLNPLMLQEITRRNVSRLLGDLKYLFGKNEENNIAEKIDNSTQLGFRLGYPGSDALARLVDNAILLTKNLLSRAEINFNYESIYSTQPTTLAETNPPPPLILNNSWIQNIILAQARISLAKNSKTYNLSTNELAILRRAIANGNTNPSSLSNIISTLNYPSLQDIKESLLSTHLPRWLSLGSSDLAPLIESIENINSTHPDLVHELIHTYIPSWINKGISSTEIEQITLSMRGLDRQTIISILPEIEHLYGSKLPKAFTGIDSYGLNEISRALNTKPDLTIYIAPYLKYYSESISGASHVKLILTLVEFPDLLPQIHNYLPKWLEGNTSVESINNYLIRLKNNPSLIALAPYFNNSFFSIFHADIIDALLQKPELVPEIMTHLPEWSLVSSKYKGMNTVAALINELQQSSPARRSLYYQHLPTYISSLTRNTDYLTNDYENLPELIRSLNTISDDNYQVIQQYIPDWISAGFTTHNTSAFYQTIATLLNSEVEYRSLTSDAITYLLTSGKFTNEISVASIVRALNSVPTSTKEIMKLLQIISQDGYPPLVDYVNTITKLQRFSEHLPAISTYLAEFHFQHKSSDSLNDLLDILPYYISHYSKEVVVHHLKIITKYPFAEYRLNRPDGPTISNLIQSTDSDTGKYILVKELIVDAVANNRLVDITNFNIEINQKVADLLENDELDLYINYLLNSKNTYPRQHQFAPDAPRTLRLFAEVPEVIISQFKNAEEFRDLLTWKERVLEDPKFFYIDGTTANKIFAGINSDIQDYSDKVGITVARLFKWLYADTYDSRLLTPITLSSWRIFNQLNPEKKALSNTEVADTLSRIDAFVKQQVRDLSSNSLSLPVGYRVSMGTEIEIKKNGLNRTGLFNLEDYIQLKRLHNMRKSSGSASVTIIDEQISTLTANINHTLNTAIQRYKFQVQPIHAYLGVGQGGDGTNEFALKPVADFDALIWELSELEQLGFISLDPQVLQWVGERGIHITISGESGIKYDNNANLLQNSLIATGYASPVINGQGGIQDAEEKSEKTVDIGNNLVTTTYSIARGLFARERGILRDIFTLIDVTGVEFRINSLSSIINLSKTLRAYNRLSIPLMVYQRNLKNIDEAKLLQTINDFIEDPTLLETIKSDYNEFLLPEISDPLERKMILIWAYYRTQSINGFAKYQLSGRLASPLNEPVSKQLIIMDGELGQVFKTTEEGSSRLLDDAFASYHEAPPKDTLPWFMQKLVDETIAAIEASFESNSQSTVSVKASTQHTILPLISTGFAWSANASISVQNTVLTALQNPVNPFFAVLPDSTKLILNAQNWFYGARGWLYNLLGSTDHIPLDSFVNID